MAYIQSNPEYCQEFAAVYSPSGFVSTNSATLNTQSFFADFDLLPAYLFQEGSLVPGKHH